MTPMYSSSWSIISTWRPKDCPEYDFDHRVVHIFTWCHKRQRRYQRACNHDAQSAGSSCTNWLWHRFFFCWSWKNDSPQETWSILWWAEAWEDAFLYLSRKSLSHAFSSLICSMGTSQGPIWTLFEPTFSGRGYLERKHIPPKLSTLPPTRVSFQAHITRAHFQAVLWQAAGEPSPPKLDPVD